ALPFVENHLQCAQAESNETEADVIDVGLGDLAAPEVRRILNQPRSQQERNDPYRNVDEEDPSPTEVVCDPSPESRTDRGGCDNGNAIDSKSHAALRRWKSVGQDGLFAGLQSSSTDALKHAAEDQNAEIWRQSAQEGTEREQRHAPHIKVLA